MENNRFKIKNLGIFGLGTASAAATVSMAKAMKAVKMTEPVKLSKKAKIAAAAVISLLAMFAAGCDKTDNGVVVGNEGTPPAGISTITDAPSDIANPAGGVAPPTTLPGEASDVAGQSGDAAETPVVTTSEAEIVNTTSADEIGFGTIGGGAVLDTSGAANTAVSPARGGEPAVTDVNANGVAATAVSLIGTPFVMDGSTPQQGFDNSGFVYYVLRSNGFVNCPRTTSGQTAMGQSVTDVSSLNPGDLVFFANEPGGPTAYGGIYIGNDEMVFSPHEGEGVRKVNMDENYWKSVFNHGVVLR